MEPSQVDQVPGAPNTLTAIHMTAYGRARAQEQMDRATIIADVILAVVARARSSLNRAGHVMYKVCGRRGVGRSPVG